MKYYEFTSIAIILTVNVDTNKKIVTSMNYMQIYEKLDSIVLTLKFYKDNTYFSVYIDIQKNQIFKETNKEYGYYKYPTTLYNLSIEERILLEPGNEIILIKELELIIERLQN